MTLNNDDGAVGDNRIAADSADVFYLTVTRTGPTSEADATLLFEGADVNLDASAEHIQALGLTTSTTPGSSGGPGFYRDELGVRTCDAADYLGSDGTLDWSAETWLELGESDGSCSGLAQLFTDGDYSLGLWGDGLGFERAVDLSMFGDAYLHFDYRRMEWEGGEAVVVEAFDEGAGVWVEIGRIDVADDDASYHAATYDLGPYTTSGARVRIRAEGLETKEDGFQLDDVQIDDDSTGLGEPPPGPPGAVAYVERNEPWAATSSFSVEPHRVANAGLE